LAKKYTYYLTLISWTFATGLYYLLALYGSENWPEWAENNSIIYRSWILFSLLLGGVHGLFFQISDNSKFRKSSYGIFISIQILFVFGLVLFANGVDLLIEIFIENLSFSDYGSLYLKNISTKASLGLFIYMMFFASIITFLRQMMLKIGPRVLGNLMLGKYHTPKKEDRIFLFLDMKSSTSIAEKLGNLKYSKLIQDCFVDLTDSLIANDVEIYQYIGDEAVMTWKVNDGIRNGNCINVYFDFMRVLEERKDYYHSNYGLQPFFKAGLNVGPVITTEVGIVRREIAYLSEVLHTAARIQGKCNEFDLGILASQKLRNLFLNAPNILFESIGLVPLRGKQNSEELFTVRIQE
jgi:adenylate cyclase